MVYYTQDQEIINLYNTYKELKTLIEQLEHAKEYLIKHNITRETNTYTILYNDKSNYNNFCKVYKIIFYEMLDKEQMEKILMLSQYATNKYYLNFFEDDLIYERITPNKNEIKSLKQLEKESKTNLFNGWMLYWFKKNLKQQIKAKLTNTQIPKI